MTENEAVLLQRFAVRRDAAAFAEIVRRHGPMVYGACMRVLADRDLAADATQETFYQLIERARQITESVPAWLHRVATRKAIDLLRNESARARREATYAANRSGEARTWRDLSLHVDEALDNLDDERRRLLIEHFFEGKSMAQMGRQCNLSGVTISRRIDEAVNVLREQLRKRGLIAAPIALSTLLAEGRAQAMPATLGRELGKMAMVGSQAATGGSTAGAAAASLGGTVVAIKTKVIVGVAAAVIAAVGIQTYRYATRPGPAPPPPRIDAPIPESSFWKPPKPDEQTRDPIGESVSEGQAPAPEKTTGPSAQPPAPPPEATDLPAENESQDQTPSESTGLDLSSPESTTRSFLRALISGDVESILACWSPDSEGYADTERIFLGDQTEAEQREFDATMRVFQALDPDAEMPVIAKEEIDDGILMKIQTTFAEDVTVEGKTLFRAGDAFEFPDVILRPSGDNWLIDDIRG